MSGLLFRWFGIGHRAAAHAKAGRNDPCWCGSGRKYKRCHKRSEGRVLQGVVSPMRSVPEHIERPPYAESGIPVHWDEPQIGRAHV